MPAQALFKFDPHEVHEPLVPRLARTPWISRLATFGGGLALTLYGGYEMYKVIDVGGVTTLKWALLALFVLNFSWIALSFASCVVGFVALLFRRRPPPRPTELAAKTAVVMPIYNEAPSRVFAALQAIFEDVEATGLGAHFDWFFLSDTTDPDIWIAEERAFIAIRRRLGPQARIFYRRPPEEHQPQGRQYRRFRHPLGRRLRAHGRARRRQPDDRARRSCALAAAMEADPDAGIIQTLPLIVNRNTLFARVQQFAARIYGPVIAAGLSCWMGRDGNYWGHNAIIRTARLRGTIAACPICAASRRSAATSSATISSRRR